MPAHVSSIYGHNDNIQKFLEVSQTKVYRLSFTCRYIDVERKEIIMEQQPLQEETIAQRLKDNEHLIDELAEGDIGALVELLHNVLSPNTPKTCKRKSSEREDYITTEILVNVFLWNIVNPGIQPDIKETIVEASTVATGIPSIEYIIDTIAGGGDHTIENVQNCLYVADNFLTLIEDKTWLVPVWTHYRYKDNYYKGFCVVQLTCYKSYGADEL